MIGAAGESRDGNQPFPTRFLPLGKPAENTRFPSHASATIAWTDAGPSPDLPISATTPESALPAALALPNSYRAIGK